MKTVLTIFFSITAIISVIVYVSYVYIVMKKLIIGLINEILTFVDTIIRKKKLEEKEREIVMYDIMFSRR